MARHRNHRGAKVALYRRRQGARTDCGQSDLSCADYWQTDHALYKTASQSDFNLLAGFAGTCQVLKALKAALPAQKNFVNDFTLDESAVDMLPPGIAIERNPAERREIKQAETDGLSWRLYQELCSSSLVSVAHESDSSALFEWTRGTSRVEILGHGDFNGDGFQDLLLHVSQWPGYGHSVKAKAHLVTRLSAGRLFPLEWRE